MIKGGRHGQTNLLHGINWGALVMQLLCMYECACVHAHVLVKCAYVLIEAGCDTFVCILNNSYYFYCAWSVSFVHVHPYIQTSKEMCINNIVDY